MQIQQGHFSVNDDLISGKMTLSYLDLEKQIFSNLKIRNFEVR